MLIAQLGTSQPDLRARQLKVLLEGAITTALVDTSPQAARDARPGGRGSPRARIC